MGRDQRPRWGQSRGEEGGDRGKGTMVGEREQRLKGRGGETGGRECMGLKGHRGEQGEAEKERGGLGGCHWKVW